MTNATEMKFHLSLNVSDLDKSVRFLRLLFDVEPAKCRPDYAKFEPPHLPVVLSLEPRRGTSGAGGVTGRGSLNHLGIRMGNSESLVDAQRRFELAGIRTQREEGVECCYARQTKFWVRDPDENLWEIYALEEDIEHRGAGQAGASLPAASTSNGGNERKTFAHRLDADWPASPAAGAFEEAALQGTFNSARFKDRWPELLADVRTSLKPGGALHVHVLTSNVPLEKVPSLPGPAAVVSHVPTKDQLLTAVAAAGFTGLELVKHGDSPCFVCEGAELRETMLVARNP
jgi:catechol 2,3-dioxygenase-like lactoylglutathione lyase family enzyme